MLNKLLDMTGNLDLCQVFKNHLKNRLFYVQLNDQSRNRKPTKKKSAARQRTGLPPPQHIHKWPAITPTMLPFHLCRWPLYLYPTRRLPEDWACPWKSPPSDVNLLLYYQRCRFHLRNKDAEKELNVTWYGYKRPNHSHPVYVGVTLDKTLSFKTHLQNANAK